MGLVPSVVSFLNLLFISAGIALFVLPISILLFLILRGAWRDGAALFDAAPRSIQRFLFLPAWTTAAVLLVTAPSACRVQSCSPPPYGLPLVAAGALLVLGTAIYVLRRHPLRSIPAGRELVIATVVAQGYYALVACLVAYGMMQGQFAPL